MSLAKLGAGGAGYYLESVAAGAEEHLTGAGEAAGVWVGFACAGLGVAGVVDPADLRAVLDGMVPDRLAVGGR